MLNINQTFHKSERLTSEVQIAGLYGKGKSFMAYPYRVVYLFEPTDELSAKVLISAPKKRFKHAVDRNHIKRLTREAYRRHKAVLYEGLQQHGISVCLALNYVGSEMISYEKSEQKIKGIIEKLLTKMG